MIEMSADSSSHYNIFGNWIEKKTEEVKKSRKVWSLKIELIQSLRTCLSQKLWFDAQRT